MKAIPAVLFAAISLQAFGFTRLPLAAEIFVVDDHKAFLMEPEKPAAGKPWLWYAPTLNSYPRRSQKFYFEQALKHGIAVAGYDLGEVRGAPASSAKFSRFYEAMIAKGYSRKPMLLGQSRGGLMMLGWAFRNPGKVRAFLGIYPVCSLTSWALKHSRKEVEADYGMSEAAIRARLPSLNPPENLAGLAKAKVPMFIIHGDADGTVPLQENSALIKTAYEKAGGDIELKVVPGKGHAEVSEFFTDADVVRFIVQQGRKQEQ